MIRTYFHPALPSPPSPIITQHIFLRLLYNDQFYHDSHISHFGLFYPSVKVVDLCGRWEKHTFLFFFMSADARLRFIAHSSWLEG